MPRKPAPPKPRRAGAAADWVHHLLITGTPPPMGTPECVPYMLELYSWPQQRPAWERLGPGIMEAWIKDHPGRRPWGWWRFSAPRDLSLRIGWYSHGQFPLARVKVGGAGLVAWESSPGIGPRFWFGTPREWCELDPARPAMIESEACYLRRFGLLEPSEIHRLRAADFRPVALEEILAGVPT